MFSKKDTSTYVDHDLYPFYIYERKKRMNITKEGLDQEKIMLYRQGIERPPVPIIVDGMVYEDELKSIGANLSTNEGMSEEDLLDIFTSKNTIEE